MVIHEGIYFEGSIILLCSPNEKCSKDFTLHECAYSTQ